jgi:hypothetical protein
MLRLPLTYLGGIGGTKTGKFGGHDAGLDATIVSIG